jgi:hypothetical protein
MYLQQQIATSPPTKTTTTTTPTILTRCAALPTRQHDLHRPRTPARICTLVRRCRGRVPSLGSSEQHLFFSPIDGRVRCRRRSRRARKTNSYFKTRVSTDALKKRKTGSAIICGRPAVTNVKPVPIDYPWCCTSDPVGHAFRRKMKADLVVHDCAEIVPVDTEVGEGPPATIWLNSKGSLRTQHNSNAFRLSPAAGHGH